MGERTITEHTRDSFTSLQRSMNHLIANDAWLDELEGLALPDPVPVGERKKSDRRRPSPFDVATKK